MRFDCPPISSWLLDHCAMALSEGEAESEFSGAVADSGVGRWAVMAAIEKAVPRPRCCRPPLYARFRSREEDTFAERLLTSVRFKLGGHVEVLLEVDHEVPCPTPYITGDG
ncbi:hypothetical protein [Ensifer aridi]|uniref:hypothetical protein n=1 Tax=Ensifer aridi TaxID=1708715 RepID=UPI00111172FA|nr:hypothetical protein [Ensifer aridi]